MNRQPVLTAENLRVRRRDGFVLHVDHLAIERQEVLALLGPNGAGKSTLLQALALLEPPQSGRIALDGVVVTGAGVAARRRMAVVLQEPLLLRGSVRDNVALGLRLHGIAKTEREGRVARWLERTGIDHLAGRNARTLSGGEQRRVSLARALALEPLVLFLDEPFAALDAPGRRSLIADLRGWLQDAGCAAVLVTHDRDEALDLADRVAVLMRGEVRHLGPIDTMLSEPVDAEVARFLGIENIISATVCSSGRDGSRIRVGGVEFVAAGTNPPGPVLIALHPEQIMLIPVDEHERIPPGNRLRGRVVKVEPSGSRLRIHLDAGLPLVALVSRPVAADLHLEVGMFLTAVITASALHVMPAEPG